AFRNRLNAQIQQLVASITEFLLASPEPSHCSCDNLQNCHIILITVINDDGTTYLEPVFRNCSCTPIWQEFHQRQLDLINADLKDLQMQTLQLTALENGVQQLLLRHRELAKEKLKKGQYWLRQDYARTDKIRWLHNLDVRKRNERRERNIIINRKRGSVAGNDGADLDWEKEIPVDAEDLYIDEDFYEFPLCVSGELSSELQCIPQADSSSQNDNIQDPQPLLKTTLNSIRRGQYLTLDEVLDRFEDFKVRAAVLINEWEDEDDTRASKIDAAYPWLTTQSSCACTAELKLYHRYRNFGNPRVYAVLEAEMLKSDIQIEQRRKTTADRGLEIELLLRSFDDHLSSQVADLEAAFGAEGTRKALAAYLRRYDQEIDLRVQIEDGGHPSEVLTLDLVKKTDEMLERWAVEDISRCTPFGDNLLKQ
ncbi:MAG: hypothetical protein L6R42_005222, partial [Xanthoria sp. 1 TBL-2021]